MPADWSILQLIWGNEMKKIFLFLLFVFCVHSYSAPRKPLLNSKGLRGETWSGRKICDLSFVMTKQHIRAQMLKLGFSEKHEISLDPRGRRQLLLFEKEKQQKLFMIRWIDAGKTEFLWGDINVKK